MMTVSRYAKLYVAVCSTALTLLLLTGDIRSRSRFAAFIAQTCLFTHLKVVCRHPAVPMTCMANKHELLTIADVSQTFGIATATQRQGTSAPTSYLPGSIISLRNMGIISFWRTLLLNCIADSLAIILNVKFLFENAVTVAWTFAIQCHSVTFCHVTCNYSTDFANSFPVWILRKDTRGRIRYSYSCSTL